MSSLAVVPGRSLVADARALLAQIRTVPDAKTLRDQFSAIAHYAREHGGLASVVAEATESRLWCERKIGELTAAMPKTSASDAGKAGGAAKAAVLAGIAPQPASAPKTEALAEAGISKHQASRYERMAKMPEAEFAKVAHERAAKTARVATGEKADPSMGAKATGDESDEWCTPVRFIIAARAVMGAIDLDPASTHLANETIRAERFHTREDSGLEHEWSGRVWLNPPYSQPLCSQFTAKLIAELGAGRVTAAIVLTNAATDTSWWQSLAGWATEICLTAGRIAFERGGKPAAGNRWGQTFFYRGPHPERFATVFGCFGAIGQIQVREGASVNGVQP